MQRRIFWSPEHGSTAPLDAWLGIAADRYSPGVREMCCREAAGKSFRHAAEDLERIGQVRLSAETLRTIVERQGLQAAAAQQRGQIRPDWTAGDCGGQHPDGTCVITGADGVKVPLVTRGEKAKRRALRRRRGPRPRCRRRRMHPGSDQPYKEFKLVAFYSPHKQHQYALGTSGNHEVLGRLMRRVGGWLELNAAKVCYSVTDGADWIRRQYNQRLPMLQANVLDYYHLREHLIEAAGRVFGEGSDEAVAWREQMLAVALEDGPVELLDRIGRLRRGLRARGKRAALEALRQYVAKRVEMLDYPQFRQRGYDIGSGPTEAFCKTLTGRLKGSGMRWDRPHAEGMMALAALRASGLWQHYWTTQRQPAA